MQYIYMYIMQMHLIGSRIVLGADVRNETLNVIPLINYMCNDQDNLSATKCPKD